MAYTRFGGCLPSRTCGTLLQFPQPVVVSERRLYPISRALSTLNPRTLHNLFLLEREGFIPPSGFAFSTDPVERSFSRYLSKRGLYNVPRVSPVCTQRRRSFSFHYFCTSSRLKYISLHDNAFDFSKNYRIIMINRSTIKIHDLFTTT